MSISKHIVIKLKERNENAFDIVYKKYINLVFHIVFGIVKNQQDAEDITQDVFIQMMNAVETFDEKNNFKYWLLQITKHKALDFIKKSKRVIIDEKYTYEFLDPKSVSKHTDFDEMMESYKGIITNEEFDVITLRIFHGLKFKDIAVIYDTTESTVNNIYHRGIAKIKKEWG